MKNIRTSAELKIKYNEISNLCKVTKKPVYITVNGECDTVLINISDYNQMALKIDLLKILLEIDDTKLA